VAQRLEGLISALLSLEKRRASSRVAALLASILVLGAFTGCQDEKQRAPGLVVPAPERKESGFRSLSDLLRSIEHGTFTKRAGTLEPEVIVPEAVKITFVSGTKVPDDEMAKLKTFASRLSPNASRKIDIVGCSDPSGSEAVNLRVSKARAESVASQLRNLGVSGEQIGQVVGRGEGCEVQERAVHITPVFHEGTGAGRRDNGDRPGAAHRSAGSFIVGRSEHEDQRECEGRIPG
jgi:outer membrane protein OmpA-like peptidoglycan-associated protein